MNPLGVISCLIAALLIPWLIWGSMQLVDVFYEQKAGMPGLGHKWWWYAVYGGGAAIALVGLAVGVIGLTVRGRSQKSAIVGIVLNGIGCTGYAAALPYP